MARGKNTKSKNTKTSNLLSLYYKGERKNNDIMHNLRSSLITYIILHVIFFPFYLAKWYFLLWKKKPFHGFLFTGFCLFSICIYISFCLITLPNVNKLLEYKPVLSSKFIDRRGEVIFEVGNERREYIDIDKIPKMLIYAFVSAEDKTFYTNSGIDLVGLGRTAIQDISKFIHRQRLAGASTITQQVVKNILLTNEYSISRKIKELILAYRVGKTLPKDKIMEIYLNHIYLGNQAYGVVSASLEYFDKSVAQLTIPEMAMLAAMPKAPSAINPFRNYKRALARRNYVLQRMAEDGYITQEQYENYASTEIVVKKRHNFYYPFYAPAFFVQSILTSKETHLTKENVLNDGYIVNLTIDGKVQRSAQRALNNSLEQYSKDHGFEGAIITFPEEEVKTKTPAELLRGVDEPENIGRFALALVVDVKKDIVKIGLKDGTYGKISLNDMLWAKQKISETERSHAEIQKCSQVLKVGDVVVVERKTKNSEYYSLEQIPKINGGVLALNPKTGEILAMVGGYNDPAGSFNRTVQAFRQLGSTIKPFIYGEALERGYTPTSIFMDADLNINIGEGIVWNPENDSKTTNGPMTLRSGLERSRNTVAIRVASEIGMKAVRKVIKKSGINDKPEGNLGIAIGDIDSSLLKLATAYSSFANDGLMPNTYIVSSVKNILPENRAVELINTTTIGENDGEKNTEQEKQNTTDILGRIYFSNCDANAECKIYFDEDIKNSENNKIQDEQNTGNAENDNQNNDENSENSDKEKEDDKKQTLARRGGIQLFSKETAYQIANILQGAVIRGTSRKLAGLGIPLASKTGTSNEGKDMWNVVITPEIVIVSFVGYDIPAATNNYGGQYALPISKDILLDIYHDYHISDFKTPEGITFVKVNRLTGKRTEEDKDAIFEAFKDNDAIPELTDEAEDIDITDIEN